MVGVLLLFATLRTLLTAFVPENREPVVNAAASRSSIYGWGLVTLTGMAIGALLFVAEVTEGGGPTPRLGQLVSIACVFVGLATAGLLIAYGFLRGPLGLWRLE